MTALATEEEDEHHACQWASLLYDPGVPLQHQESFTWRDGDHGPQQMPRPDIFSKATLTHLSIGHRELTHNNFCLLSNTESIRVVAGK